MGIPPVFTPASGLLKAPGSVVLGSPDVGLSLEVFMKNVEASVVRNAASGNWESILTTLAPSIPSAAYEKLGRHVACPVHSAGKGDGFKLFKRDFHDCGGGGCNTCGHFNDGFKLLMWINNWDFVTALVEVAMFLGITSKSDEMTQRVINRQREAEAHEARKKRAEKEAADDVRIRARLNKIWSGTIPLTAKEAEPARLYLSGRKILGWDREGLDVAVRFHPALPSYDEDRNYEGDFPAIVAKVSDSTGKACTVHRIFITEKGEKAPVQSCKKMYQVPTNREVMGGGIFTSTPGEVIDVCEGIETALAIETAMRIPVWPLVNATMMEGFIPPEGVKEVRIWVDNDVSGRGLQAGKALKARLWELGVRASLLVPTLAIPAGAKGVDWNDVLVTMGRFGFPVRARREAA